MSTDLISHLLPAFTDYMAIERRFSPATIKKYREDLEWFMRHVGDVPVADLRAEHFFMIKSLLTKKGAHASRISSVIAGVKALLFYCGASLHLAVFDPKQIRAPRIPRREVVYLTGGGGHSIDLRASSCDLRSRRHVAF